VTSKKTLDGRTLKPLLVQEKNSWKERTLINYWKGKVSARTQRFRLDHQRKLFDLIKDPGQRIDVSRTQSEVAKQLLKEVTEWEENVLSELVKDTRPFIIGHPDYLWTQIPARDGVAHGGIKRSGRAPNCSYFMNWKRTEDKIIWDCEVGSTGTYEISIHYALPKGDEGTVLELSHNQSKIQYTITEPHEVQNRGHENDRVTRRESYVKDFKEVKIGEMKLNKGKGELTLRALEIPGDTSIEFRLMMLKRIQ
jgi:hypothetical protein